MPKPTGSTNPNLLEIIIKMERKKEGFYKALVKQLKKSRRVKKAVTLFKINKLTKEGENIVVPGKVVGNTDIKKINVYAWHFSASAQKKIENAGGKALPLNDVIDNSIKGRVII